MPPPRTVLVTGTSTGIGRACALDLHARGYHVFAGVRAAPDGDALRAATGDRLVPLLLDVTQPAHVTAALDTLRAHVGDAGLQGLVNNAGVAVPGPMEYLSLQALREQFEVNVFGTLDLTQACLPLLRPSRGRIVNVSSVNGRVVTPFNGAYCASKFALEAISDALRRELQPTGVRVVLVEPGSIRTAIRDTAKANARQLAEEYPDVVRQHYGGVLRRLEQVQTPAHALAPERVARIVARALEARRPRARYRVGWDARLGVMAAHLLPTSALDALLSRWH
jgi:NAD(P)-dependent dehydrogenase (short-subunit alcohol dehydrogenase family)